ncbi:MAG: protein-L-isoaspartate O-methyltransferase [Oxalobacter sp.]|nr:protein-L-isoaspartate O-methyltransferase [Oxalobacter sp.]MBR5999790.1 protein-L-isoaspartate O-methyltransferase [Oxalobacter sp.]
MLNAYQNMIENQLRAGGITLPSIFEAFDQVDRQSFVPQSYQRFAYADMPIPLEGAQEMFSPLTEARILQAINPTKNDNLLEIGTGSGFSAALSAHLARYVTSLEIDPSKAKSAMLRLEQENIRNTRVICYDGFLYNLNQTTEKFDIITFSGSVSSLPVTFLDRLADGGKLFYFKSQPSLDFAELVMKDTDGNIKTHRLFETKVTALVEPREEKFTF